MTHREVTSCAQLLLLLLLQLEFYVTSPDSYSLGKLWLRTITTLQLSSLSFLRTSSNFKEQTRQLIY